MIKFGTSGWRGVIGEDFTFQQVRVASQGIVNYLKRIGTAPKGVVIGYDTRFLSEKFALEAAKIVAYNGIQAWLCDRDIPTPVVAFETIRRGAAGAINFTASHNPPEYNGLKFSLPDGSPALPEITNEIEREIRAIEAVGATLEVYEKPELIESIDPKGRYLGALREMLDNDAIRQSGLKIAVDALYGTSRDYLDYFLLEAGVELRIIHNYRDPYFGGFSPESSQKNLGELRRIVGTEGYDVGLATDGDADRFGIIDDRGRYVPANTILGLLALYLKRERGITGGLARSVATTHVIDAIAERLDVPLYETPVGFKYIGELILEGKIAMGGEESGGLSIRDHLPEKDGILACLLVAEMMARTGKKLTELIHDMTQEFGPYLSKRIDIRLNPSFDQFLREKLANPPSEIDGLQVVRTNAMDGVKFMFPERAWLLFRLSGTQPIARIYAEACRPSDLKKLISIGRRFVQK